MTNAGLPETSMRCSRRRTRSTPPPPGSVLRSTYPTAGSTMRSRVFCKARTPSPTTILEMPGLRCEVASAETVLVLKCLAHRLGEDDEDIALLAAQLGLETADQVLD